MCSPWSSEAGWCKEKQRTSQKLSPLKFAKRPFIMFMGMNIHSGEATLSKLFLSPFDQGFILKGKNLLPWGANSFLSETSPVHKGLSVHESKQEVRKVFPLVKMTKILHSVASHLNP